MYTTVGLGSVAFAKELNKLKKLNKVVALFNAQQRNNNGQPILSPLPGGYGVHLSGSYLREGFLSEQLSFACLP